MYLSIAILCATIVPGSFCYENIHLFMTPEEVRHVFQTDSDSVPEYEIVKINMPQRLHEKYLPSGSRLHMTAFGENINLWIHPRDSILAGVDTPVYYAKHSESAPGGVEYRRQYGLMEMVGRIFEDPNKMASLVIGREDTGRTRVNGYIESNRLAIRSLPQRVADEYSRRRRSVDDLEHPQYSPYHVVIKTDGFFEDNYSHSPVNETRLRERLSRSVTKVPDTLYPEILVVVDNTVYTMYDTPQGHDIYGLLEYLLAFWNSVDLRYRSLESPKFRLNIAGIVLAEIIPYTSISTLEKSTCKQWMLARHNTLTLPAFRYFLYKVQETFPFGSYDVAVTMTSLDFGLEGWRYVWGVAVTGVSCKINHYYKTFETVALCRDDGAFAGVQVVAHELGHLLGSQHDVHSSDCSVLNGFIMGRQTVWTTNSSDFSSCSIDQFQSKLDNGNYTCFRNEPKNTGKSLPKLMPGRMQNLVEQCKNEGLGAPCRNETATTSLCVNIFCSENNGECRQTKIAALDGTDCEGKNKFCLHQHCVSL